MILDIRALLTLLLLKNGVDANEIQVVQRIAAAAETESVLAGTQTEGPTIAMSELASITTRQTVRNEQLAPISAKKGMCA